MLFAPLSWHSEDLDRAHVIFAFGRLEDGRSAAVRFEWKPRFYVSLTGDLTSAARQQGLLDRFPNRDLTLSQVIKRVSIYGFTNGRMDAFLCLAFRTQSQCRSAMYAVKDMGHSTFEAAATPLAQFLHSADIRPCRWLSLTGEQQLGRASRLSVCDVELSMRRPEHVRQAQDAPTAPVPWVVASWDLETYSPDNRFPNPDDPDCPIIQIGVSIATYQRPGTHKVVITTTPCMPVEGVEIIQAQDEAGALRQFAAVLRRHQVDIMVAWNGFGFDNRYLMVRASNLNVDEELRFSKLADRSLASYTCTIKERECMLLKLPGILQYDPMQHLRSENRFDSYKLDHVASLVTGEHKVDLAYDELFRLHREGGPSGQATIAFYCSTDCDLPLLIMDKMALVANILSLSNACRTPADLVLTRGQVSVLDVSRPLPEPSLFAGQAADFLFPDVLRDPPSHG